MEAVYSADSIRSTSDMTYNALRQGILNHRFPAGSRLVEAKVAKDLNVSATPVREAFRKLSAQGLLVSYPFKGTYVTQLSQADVNDIYRVRYFMECEACEAALPKMEPEDIELAEALSKAAEKAEEKGEIAEAVRCDLALHSICVRVSGSTVLQELWDGIRYRIELIQSYQKPITKARSSERHMEFIEAMRNRDAERYKAAAKEHLKNIAVFTFPDKGDIVYK